MPESVQRTRRKPLASAGGSSRVSEITKFLREISKKPTDKHLLSIYINSKGNAKLGDALVNLVYSIAKTLVTTYPTGVKVSDSILAASDLRCHLRKSKSPPCSDAKLYNA